MPNSSFARLLLLSVLVAGPAFPQPTSPATAPIPAPVPVREEPYHRVAFENDYVRVIDVYIPPKVSTLYHIHTLPSVVVELTKSTILSEELGQPLPAPKQVEPGQTRYAPYDETPLTHRVTNQGTNVFHVMDIELVKPNTGDGLSAAVEVPGMKMAWERKLVRAYDVYVAAGQSCMVPPGNNAYLLISVSGRSDAFAGFDGRVTQRPLGAGEFLFLPARASVKLTPRAKDDCAYVLLELK